GNITNNGTFNNEPGTGTSTYTLTSTSGTLGGSNELVIKDVEISSSGSYTNVNLFTVERALTGSGTFINGAAGTFTYTGDNSSGTNFTITNFDPTTTGNTVVFAGTTNQQWRGTTGTNNDYYNVIVDMASGGSTRLNLSSDVRVNGTLTITEGDPVLGTYDLELGASSTITGGDANDWLRITSTGVVRQYYDAVGDDKVFPIGDTDDYSPITSMVITSATLGSNAYLEFTVTDAAHPNRSTGNEELGGDDEGVEATAYITRYWTVTANDISLPFYTVSYQYIDDDVVGTESDMIGTLYAQPPGESFYDWSDIGTVNATNNTATISDSEYWGVLYAQDDKMDRLPVQLISFNAEATVNSVMLKWKTATEENNSFFSIERSVDGLNFKEIGQKQGFGNSSAIQLYSFVDSYPLNGRTFYRLKQVDFNGQYEYSEVITVVWNGTGIQGRLNVYPNPVQVGQNLSVSIEGNDPATISWLLLDMNGRVVYEGNFTNSGLLQINTSEMKDGVYLLRIYGPEKAAETRKVIIR
ncbi:MAG: T9SS type A sorting domain-containing protein, partial [Cytophagia bacterium]|nr:T9SS type A sorting domain-containing protein [Cytophagia bacterium]